ncbi:putative cold-shock DNA-binding protein [Saccharothrix carnea]|uniref:Putative cold-shock DNA-binding protein n=1 Tax=Saccharothrix carnea TaxID=1280637 RepID=A0A2P8HZL2_SACCR|nr:putative cold-shock DNA-binding protein [Saccharothrix carnea]
MVVKGKVVRFDEVRGYGFVSPEEGGEDVFIHVNDIDFDKRLMAPGALVEFLVEMGDRGPKASRVSLVREASVRSGASSYHSGDDVNGNDMFCEVVSTKRYLQEVTETLLAAAPGMTAEQILNVRKNLVGMARKYNWIED